MSGVEDAEHERKNFKSPYTAQHPIPTVRQYREEKERRKDVNGGVEVDDKQNQHPDGYGAANKNVSAASSIIARDESDDDGGTREESDSEDDDKGGDPEPDFGDTSQAVSTENDPKQKRKNLKKRKDDRAGREVTDPVTHLPVMIHDFTGEDLKRANEEEPELTGELQRIASDMSSAGKKNGNELQKDTNHGQKAHAGLERLFPPPEFDDTRKQITAIHRRSFTTSILLALSIYGLTFVAEYILAKVFNKDSNQSTRQPIPGYYVIRAIAVLSVGASILFVRSWNEKALTKVWDSNVWEAERQQGKEITKSQTPESTHWMNALLASIWPLINPDLFISLADTLEDVMQASLPRLVRMISVEDIGQGSEAFRILGVRWLPKGAATHSVTTDGRLERKTTDPQNSDRTVPGLGSVQSAQDSGDTKKKPNESNQQTKQDEQEHENVEEGMEAEEGDFVNLEIAFAYKARLSDHGMRSRSKNPHLYLAFYLPTSIRLRKSRSKEGHSSLLTCQ
jgi:hypothetical protein